MIRTQGFDYLQIQNFPSANLLSWSVLSWLYMVECHLKCFDISAIHYLSLRYHNSKKDTWTSEQNHTPVTVELVQENS